jgi:serine phosphatase RsbU (regulator of sigma subunit)/Tfp pilus assembly protein PilF
MTNTSKKTSLIIILLLLVVFIPTQADAQLSKIDSLHKLGSKDVTDTARVQRWLLLSELHLLENGDSTIYYAKLAIKKSKEIKFRKGEGAGFLNLGMALNDKSRYDSALFCLNNALKLFSAKEKNLISNANNEKGRIYFSRGNLKEAKAEFEKSLAYKLEAKDSAGMASGYNNLGVVCRNMSDYKCALDNYFKALRIREKMNNIRGIGQSYTNIAIVYGNLSQHEKSLEYDYKALKIKQELNDKFGIAKSYNNLASTYSVLEKYDSAIYYNEKAIAIRLVIEDKSGLASSYYNLGGLFVNLGENTKASSYLKKALDIYIELEERPGQSLCYLALGSVQRNLKNYKEAENSYIKALQLVKETGTTDQLKDLYSELSLVGAESKDYQKAYYWIKLLMNYKDSVLNEGNNEKLAELEKIYQTEKKELKIQNLLQENEIKQSEIAHNKLRSISLLVVLILVAGFGIVTFRSLRNKQKANQVITLQKLEVEHQKSIIEEKNKDITDSINYAKHLQQAILPPQKLVSKYLPESFILYKPKDIVAGDFYWMEVIGDSVLIAAADCTGHGVPGAMVSVVCSNALNRAVKEFSITEPGKILDKVTDLVIETFERSESEVKDGMDISLCVLNTVTKEISWAGANNPLWILEKKTHALREIKADKQPIGKYSNRVAFNTHHINLYEGDAIYLFTDGFADQFGGPKGKKFKYSKLKELILSTNNKTMSEQKEILNDSFETWKTNLEQVDDVCIIGIRI